VLVFLGLSLTGCKSNSSSSEPDHVGKQTYMKYCVTCHAAGIADAPKFGDLEEWQSRIDKGREELLKTTIEGIPPGMPVKGLCMGCTDQELADAIDYMLDAVADSPQ